MQWQQHAEPKRPNTCSSLQCRSLADYSDPLRILGGSLGGSLADYSVVSCVTPVGVCHSIGRLSPNYTSPAANELPPPEGGWGVTAAATASSGGRLHLLEALDPRTAFVLHVPADAAPSLPTIGSAAGPTAAGARAGEERCFIWIGRSARPEFVDAARRWAASLRAFERAPAAMEEAQGRESSDFWSAVGSGGGSHSTSIARYFVVPVEYHQGQTERQQHTCACYTRGK